MVSSLKRWAVGGQNGGEETSLDKEFRHWGSGLQLTLSLTYYVDRRLGK